MHYRELRTLIRKLKDRKQEASKRDDVAEVIRLNLIIATLKAKAHSARQELFNKTKTNAIHQTRKHL